MLSTEDPRIDDFAVLHEGYRLLHAALERSLDAQGLGPFLWHEVLLRLARSPQGQLPVTELARQVLITPGSFTRVLDRIEDAGLLVRLPSPTSRRSTLVTLTRQGRLRAARSAAACVTCLDEHLFSHLGREGRAQLVEVMAIVRAANQT